MTRFPLIVAIGLTACATRYLHAQSTQPASPQREIKTHILQPAQLPADRANIEKLKLPKGFELSVFADGLKAPRIIVTADDGSVYVTSREVGNCILLKDSDGDGKADTRKVVAERPGLHGLMLSPDQTRAYFVTVNELYEAARNADGTFGEPKKLIKDLPDGGQHPNRTLAFGPDRMLYLSVGSTTNAANEPNPELATILKLSRDATSRTIFARGLRNTIGFAWHPQTKQMWGLDHGIDYLGDENDQREELNRIEEGKHYGWPIVYNDGKVNLQPPPPNQMSREQWVKMTEKPVLTYSPHAAPMQFLFYTANQFPGAYRNDAFATMRGSWNANPPTGYEVVRIHFENGQPKTIEPFLTGFLVKQPDGSYGQFARLVGLAVAKDGALLVGDDTNGVIYRIAYKGDRQN